MRLVAALSLVVCFCAVAPTGVRAWGAEGHRIINGDAIRALPESVPPFVRTPDAIAEIAALGPDPDQLRDGGKAFESDTLGAHFLDLADDGTVDGVVSLKNLPPTREAYDTAVRRGAPIENRPADEFVAGYLPYSIVEGWQQLVEDFALWRVDAYGEAHAADPHERDAFAFDRRLRELLVVHDIGYWGHFVADASQPLHVSVHYNGWGDYPNPNGYSTSHTVHADFETKFVNAHATPENVLPRIGPYVPSTEPIFSRVATYLLATNAGVEPVYRMVASGAFAASTPDAVNFTLDRLAAGAQELRDLVADAYVASATAVVSYPYVKVQDVLGGAVPPPSPHVRN